MPTCGDMDKELLNLNQLFETYSAEAILEWALDRFGSTMAMTTALGPGGCSLVHMLSLRGAQVRIISLDTGYLFPETVSLKKRLEDRYGLSIEWVRPPSDRDKYEALNGGPVHSREPNRCCRERKIAPLQQALEGQGAWLTGVRRDQTLQRSQTNPIEWASQYDLWKVNPLFGWNLKDVWRYVTKERIPYNPLHDEGYPSIGCQPCTAPVCAGGTERDGRWQGTSKIECGIHLSEPESEDPKAQSPTSPRPDKPAHRP